MPDNLKWDLRFLELAALVATWSKDPSTRNGAAIVDSDRRIRTTGYNGFPRGVEDTEERLAHRELKYPLTVHAEVNAVVNAARAGISTLGCTMYCTWPPCTPCADVIINAGITRLVTPQVVMPARWKEDCEQAARILVEAGVVVNYIETEVG